MAQKKLSTLLKSEKISVEKVSQARAESNWNMLATELHFLCGVRADIAHFAKNGKRVQIIDSIELGDEITGGGRYLVQPPLVGRDAGIIHGALRERGWAAIVLCREPLTSLGLCPIVALGSGVIVRVQIEEPKNPSKPTCAWFDHAIVELGEHVLSKTDKNSTSQRQLDYLLAHLPAVSICPSIYGAGIALCRTLCEEGS
jgi:hypothetical protein